MASVKNGGLDIGTSNTAFSYMNKNGELFSYKYKEEYNQIPSILYSTNGVVTIGYEAREEYGLSTENGLYRSFKMHVDVKEKERLEALGYVEMTPDEVMEKFVTEYLEGYLEEQGIQQLETLVLGAPEVFFCSETGADKRMEIKRIVERSKVAKRVRLISEPTAAATYYVYKSELNKPARGSARLNDDCYLLTIDGGGGTLDICLCKLGLKNGKRTIYTVARSGAGEHFENTKSYSQCGVYYFEEVIREAIKAAYPDQINIKEVVEFQKTYYQLESRVRNTSGSEAKAMKLFFEKKSENRDEEYLREHADDGFVSIKYEGKKLPVPFRLMYEVYQKTFEGILNRELDAICAYTKEHDIDVPYMRRSDGNAGDSKFRVITVGGFCSYPLVQIQVEKYFNKKRTGDPRFGIIDPKESSLAIAHGLALLANGVVEYSMRAPYGLGVIGEIDSKSGETAFIGVKYGDFLEPSVDEKNPFFAHIGNCKTKKERMKARIPFTGDSLEYLGYDNGSSVGMVKRRVSDRLKQEIKGIIKKHASPDGKDPYFNMAFSFDESGQLYIHIIEATGKEVLDGTEWRETIGPWKFDEIFVREISAVAPVKVK